MITGIANFKENTQLLVFRKKKQKQKNPKQFTLTITAYLPPFIIQCTTIWPLPQPSAKSVFIMLISDFHIGKPEGFMP